MKGRKFGDQRDYKVLVELTNSDNWAPIYSKIAKKLKMPVSSVYDIVNRLKENKVIEGKFIIKLKL